MNRARIKTAIRYLKSIPPDEADKHFAMYEWNSSYRYSTVRKKPWQCGTTACAAGWLCEVPEFIEQGLRPSVFSGAPMFGRESLGDHAMAKFFDISFGAANDIFMTDLHLRGRHGLEIVIRKLENLLLPPFT